MNADHFRDAHRISFHFMCRNVMAITDEFYFVICLKHECAAKCSFAKCFHDRTDFHVILFPAHFYSVACSVSVARHFIQARFQIWLLFIWWEFKRSEFHLIVNSITWSCMVSHSIYDQRQIVHGKHDERIELKTTSKKMSTNSTENSPKRHTFTSIVCVSKLKPQPNTFAGNSLTINYIDEQVGPCNRISCANNNVNENLSMLFGGKPQIKWSMTSEHASRIAW